MTTIEMRTKTEPRIPAKMIAGWPELFLSPVIGDVATGRVQFAPANLNMVSFSMLFHEAATDLRRREGTCSR